MAPSLRLAEVGLAAVWLGLGRSPAALRLVGTVAVVTWWTDKWPQDMGVAEECALLLSGQVGLIVLPLLSARSFGARLSRTEPTLKAGQEIAVHRPIQFTLRDMLLWTAGVAVSCVMIRSVSIGALSPLPDLNWVFFAQTIGPAAIVLAALWSVLGTCSWRVRLILPASALLSVVAATLLAASTFRGQTWGVLAAILLSCTFCGGLVLLIGALLVFRTAGYRLVWRERGDRPGGETEDALEFDSRPL